MLLKVGMQFRLPIAIPERANFRVDFSDTVVISQDGSEQLTQFERQLFSR